MEVVAARDHRRPPSRPGPRSPALLVRLARRPRPRVSFVEDVRAELVGAAAGRVPAAGWRCSAGARAHRRLVPPARARRGARRGATAQPPPPPAVLVELVRELRRDAARSARYRERRFGRRARFQIMLGGDPRTLQVLQEAGVLGGVARARAGRRRRASLGALVLPRRLPARRVPRRRLAWPRRAGRRTWRSATHDARRRPSDLAGARRADGIPLARARPAAARGRLREAPRDDARPARAIGADGAALRLAEAEVVARRAASANRHANADAGEPAPPGRAAAGSSPRSSARRRRRARRPAPAELRAASRCALRAAGLRAARLARPRGAAAAKSSSPRG